VHHAAVTTLDRCYSRHPTARCPTCCGVDARRSASPGHLAAFEDELLQHADMVDLPVVMAVTLALVGGVRRVGVAYLDAGHHRLGAAEFADDDQFCTLEAVSLQLGAKECAVLKVLAPRHGDMLQRHGKCLDDSVELCVRMRL
jgi:hypothetical protein